MPRHPAQEFRKFLDEVEHNVPTGLEVHVVMDNASSHKTRLIGVAKRNSANHERSRKEWIEIPVPAIINEETFAMPWSC